MKNVKRNVVLMFKSSQGLLVSSALGVDVRVAQEKALVLTVESILGC